MHAEEPANEGLQRLHGALASGFLHAVDVEAWSRGAEMQERRVHGPHAGVVGVSKQGWLGVEPYFCEVACKEGFAMLQRRFVHFDAARLGFNGWNKSDHTGTGAHWAGLPQDIVIRARIPLQPSPFQKAGIGLSHRGRFLAGLQVAIGVNDVEVTVRVPGKLVLELVFAVAQIAAGGHKVGLVPTGQNPLEGLQ